MQVKGQDIVAVIELGRYPGITLAVKKDRVDKIKTIADLKGAKIGVTAPGSSTNMIAQFLMTKACGLKPDDASFLGVGAGPAAVAAIRQGEIDAISNIDPVIAMLEASGDVVVFAETRTTEGATKVFGGTMSAAVAYLKRDFIDKNPNTVQALVNAFYKTLWLDKATPEQIANNVPQEYWLGDKALYMRAVQANYQVYSRDGIVSDGSQKRSIDFLKQFDKEIAAATVDTTKTWTDRFVKKAAMVIK